MIEPNNISYRDTAARVVKKESGYYRYIFHEYKSEYDHLMQSGLYNELTQKDLLIKHQEIKIDTDEPKVYKLLYPAQMPFQSYPFEWSYTQWRKAILAYLRINHIALTYGMILKDATPYNFYLTGGKAIMFDTSSFMFFKKNDKWIAYRQFCEEFLSPVALMYYNGTEWSKSTLAYRKGIPLSFVSKQLPFKSYLNLTTLFHIHLHSKYFGNNKTDTVKSRVNNGFTFEKIKSLQKMVFNTISKWKTPYQIANHWSAYYETDIESKEYLRDKEETIRKWLGIIKPKTVLDVGANTGKFSFIAAEYAEKVISLEADEKCVNEIEEKIKLRNISNIYAIVGDISSPTPTLGLDYGETSNLYSRANSETLLGLAIIHHINIIDRINLSQIALIFSNLCQKYLIIEFIPITDEKFILLTKSRMEIFHNYNLPNFIYSFGIYFEILENKKIASSNRVLYLWKKKSLV